MKRVYKIHDENGLVYNDSEHFILMMWTYLTQPIETTERLLSLTNLDDVKKALSNRKITGDLRLLREMTTYKNESNEQKNKNSWLEKINQFIFMMTLTYMN